MHLLPVPGFGGPTGPVLGYVFSSANVPQVYLCILSRDFTSWCDVTGVCMQIQYSLRNLYPFRCVYCITHNVSNVGETTSIK